MYVKLLGKSKVVFENSSCHGVCSPQLGSNAVLRLSLKNSMRHSTRQNGLYQPTLYRGILQSCTWIHAVFPLYHFWVQEIYFTKKCSLYTSLVMLFWACSFLHHRSFCTLSSPFLFHYLTISVKEIWSFWMLEDKRIDNAHWSGLKKLKMFKIMLLCLY